jgi:hypothetical protein
VADRQVRAESVGREGCNIVNMTRMARLAAIWALALLVCVPISAQTPSTGNAMTAYKALHAFALDGGSARVTSLVLKRDRPQMTFTGTFYFPKPMMARTTGAVFIGQGRFHADPRTTSSRRRI